uniref:Immunoglobulin V-set domain-containing protein n=1 Tax=Mastacembelus armatus TaxID=205130 RepID=A0A7N8Y5X3_9TELE
MGNLESPLNLTYVFGVWEETEQCNKVLIETNSKAKSDRYSIDYGSRRFFNVTITQLTKSDSGRYRCGYVLYFINLKPPPTPSGFLYQTEAFLTVTWWAFSCFHSPMSTFLGYTLPLVVSLVVTGLLATFLLLLYKWKIRTSSNCELPSSFNNL